MATPRTRLTDAEWNQHKPYIRRMIIDQNMSQEEARQRLKDDGVLVTKAQLEYKLKIWGFRKKAPKEKSDVIWQFIGHRVEKRKQQQKASDVLLNGQLVDPAKVRKEVNRHQPTSLVRYRQAAMSPKTPKSPKVVILTPASTPTQYLWPSCLPWLQFRRSLSLLLQPSEVFDHVSIKFMAQREAASLYSFSHVIGESAIRNVSRLTSSLSILMPESCKNENRDRARLLLCGSPKEALIEQVNLKFYEISNRFGNLDINTDEGMDDDQWRSITVLLEESGIMKMHYQLRKITDKTLLSVTEALFQEAFHHLYSEYRYNYWYVNFAKEQNDDLDSEADQQEYETWDGECDSDWDADMLAKLPSWRIIIWLLSCGQDPNTPIPSRDKYDEKRYTPLQQAASMNFPRLIFLLLEANSDPTLVFDEPRLFIELFLELRGSSADKVRVLKHLLGDSACAGFFEGPQRASLLAAAIDGLRYELDVSDVELLDMLIGTEAKSCAKYRSHSPWSWGIKPCSILGYASSNRSILGHAAGHPTELVAMSCLSHLLERFSLSETSLLPAQFITPDVVLLAASRGHNEVLEFLHDFNVVDVALCGYRGITALHVAACSGHLETCQLLLELGVPVDGHIEFQHIPSPLHLAVCGSHFEIVQLLHGHGGQLTRSITQDERWYWRDAIQSEGAVSPIGAAVLGGKGNRPIMEYFAQQGVAFPPWAAHVEKSRSSLRPWAAYIEKSRSLRPRDVRLALKMGADPNWTERDGMSALQVVLKSPRGLDASDAVEIAMALLDAGAILNGGELFDSILLDNRTLTNRLLEMHRLSTSQLDESISVLEAAIAMDDQYLTTQILTQHPGAYDAGALCSSVLFEDHGLRTVKFLLGNRPQVQRVLPLESLAIGIAAWRDRVDLLDLLLTKIRKPSTATLPKDMLNSFCVDHKDIFTGIEIAKSQRRLFWREDTQIAISPLSLALKTKKSLARLLEHGFLPDWLTMSVVAVSGDHGLIGKLSGYPMLTHGFTDYEGPLAATVRRNDIDVVKCLLDGNCYVNEGYSRVDSGRSPLQTAVEHGYLDLIKLLLDAGADVNAPAADWRGATALQLAAITGYLGVTKMLVDHGADLNAPGALYYGRTALEGAAEHGRIDTIQYLLSEGVEINGKGRLSYLRAIRYAEIEVHVVAVNLLKTWREWTADDDALWGKLKSLSKNRCEHFNEEGSEYEEDSEDQLALEPEPEGDSSGNTNEGDRLQDLVLDDAPTGAARMHNTSVTASAGDGIVSELEDLEMMTSNTFFFLV